MLISGSFCISRILGAKSQKEYGMQESVQFVTVCAYWIKTLYTCSHTNLIILIYSIILYISKYSYKNQGKAKNSKKTNKREERNRKINTEKKGEEKKKGKFF